MVSEEVNGENELVELSISAKGLDNMDTFSKSDPFLQIQRYWRKNFIILTNKISNIAILIFKYKQKDNFYYYSYILHSKEILVMLIYKKKNFFCCYI